MDKVEGGYLYLDHPTYTIKVIDDKTGYVLSRFALDDVNEAHSFALHKHNTTQWITWDDLCALRRKNKR